MNNKMTTLISKKHVIYKNTHPCPVQFCSGTRYISNWHAAVLI